MNMNDYRKAERIRYWLAENGFRLNGGSSGNSEVIQLMLTPGRWSGFADEASWFFSSIDEAVGFARGMLEGLTTFKKCSHKPLKKKR